MPRYPIFPQLCAVTLALAACIAPIDEAQNSRGSGTQIEEGQYFTSISPEMLREVLSGEEGRISLDEDDDTTLEGRVEGKNYDVFFYECDGGDFAAPATPNSSCLGFEYRALFEGLSSEKPDGYPSDIETVNAWNNAYHYGSLWRNDDGDLSLQLNVIVEGGITEKNIQTTFLWWQAVLTSFDEFMDGR